MSFIQALNSIIADVIAPNTEQTDKNATFPRSAIDSLGKAGILGLVSNKEVGGMGLGLTEAAHTVEKIAQICPSTAMVLTMHFCGTAIIEKYGSTELRKQIAAGKHLTTLAWSEVGSRSHFWAPTGTARKNQNGFTLDCKKTMVTSALEADSYVWTSKPVSVTGAATMWLVEKNNPGLGNMKAFDGFGLRGNASAPMSSENMKLAESAMLGTDGGGFDMMIGIVLPYFCTLSASCSIGIMESSLTSAIKHISENKLEHLNSALSDLPTIRAYLAKAKINLDMSQTLRNDTLTALKENRPDAMLRVMEVKAASADAALEVTDTCMRVCGGAAFRKDIGIERLFRDARASHIMAPTSDVLYDFIGKAICNLPVFG